jgi:hypothetical protein
MILIQPTEIARCDGYLLGANLQRSALQGQPGLPFIVSLAVPFDAVRAIATELGPTS